MIGGTLFGDLEGDVLVVEGGVEGVVLAEGEPGGGGGDPVLAGLDACVAVEHVDIVRDAGASETADDGVADDEEVGGVDHAGLAHPEGLVGVDVDGHEVVALGVLVGGGHGGEGEIEHAVLDHGPLDILEEAVLGGDGEVADVVDALHLTRGVEEHDEMGIAATTGEILLGLAPGEGLLAGDTAVDGHGEVTVGKHVVERPLVFIDGRHALRNAEIGIVPSERGMADNVA